MAGTILAQSVIDTMNSEVMPGFNSNIEKLSSIVSELSALLNEEVAKDFASGVELGNDLVQDLVATVNELADGQDTVMSDLKLLSKALKEHLDYCTQINKMQ